MIKNVAHVSCPNSLRFRCPHCSLWTNQAAGPVVVMLLLRAGAHVENSRSPLNTPALVDHGPHRAIAAINHDEIDLRVALDRLPTAIRPPSSDDDEPRPNTLMTR